MSEAGLKGDDSFMVHLRGVRERARCLHDRQAVDAAIAKLAAQLSADYAGRNPLLLTVMNGGVVLAGQLLPLLDFPLEIDYLHATRYNNTTSGSALSWRARPGTSLKGRAVLILDDILDVGSTLLAILEHCRQEGVESVASVVLVDKQHERKAVPGLKADYTGLYAEDAYLFGYGMDYRGYWRNAPGIFAVADSDLD